jgi:hypothetical protein
LDLLHHKDLREAWECLHEMGSMKDDLGRLLVPHCFHEKFCSNYFKLLMLQQEHSHAVVPGDFVHKSLRNWLMNKRSYTSDFENKSGSNNYTLYPAYYDLMIDSGVTAYKH